MLLDGFFQLVQHHAALVALHGDQLGLIQIERLHIAKEGGAFHQHGVAGVDESLEQQVHAAGGARGGQHAVGFKVEAVHFGKIAAQAFHKGRIALRSAILQNALAIGLEHIGSQFGANLIRQSRQRRIAARKTDHAGLGQILEDLSNGAAGNAVKALRKSQTFRDHLFQPPSKIKSRLSPRFGEEGDVDRGTTSVWHAKKRMPSVSQERLSRCKRRTVGSATEFVCSRPGSGRYSSKLPPPSSTSRRLS